MTHDDHDQTKRSNRPVEVLRDGALKLSIFRNQGEQGPSYSMVPGRVYTDKETGQVREASSFNANEALRVAHLMTKGHERVLHHRSQDKEKQAPDRGAGQSPKRDKGFGHDDHFNRENGFDRER